jgi:uncharacterized protein involved in outer membrane biogenesis
MRLKVSFYGFALALIGFLAPLVVFAAFLPSLINAEPVKMRFVEELKSWTGAEVELAGPVAIESFFSLSLKAENVVFKAFGKAPTLRDVEAAQIVARISWIDLLSGNLDFDDVKIDNAVFNLGPTSKEAIADTLRSLLAGSYRTPFAAVVIANGKINIAGDEHAEASEARISDLIVNVRDSDGGINVNGRVTWRSEKVELDIKSKAIMPAEERQSVPLKVDVASQHLTGRFEGELNAGKDGAINGQIEVSTTNPSALSEWLGWGISFDLADPIRISAKVDMSGKSIHLQSGTFSAAGEEASGDLNIALAGSPRLEGALAFDSLDIANFWDGGSKRLHDSAVEAPFARFWGRQNLDLRISATEARWRTLALGTAAFTLTGQDGEMISEIARLDFFGGSIFGHLEADFRDASPRIKGRVTAKEIDAAKLAALALQDGGLTGRVDANIEFQAEGWTASQLGESFKAQVRADFPEGGQMQLDLLQLAQSASAEGQDGWNNSALSWWAFDDLRFKLSLDKDRLRFADLILRSANDEVRGAGEIDLQERHLDWRLKIDSDQNKGGPGAQTNQERRPEASLFIRGPWAKPSIRLSPLPSRAGANMFSAPSAHSVGNRL